MPNVRRMHFGASDVIMQTGAYAILFRVMDLLLTAANLTEKYMQ